MRDATMRAYQFRKSLFSGEITFDYQGSIMSQIKDSQLPKELLELKRFFVDLHALDLLAPEANLLLTCCLTIKLMMVRSISTESTWTV
jgi:hypothetical protein